jgi:hypothetical protein
MKSGLATTLGVSTTSLKLGKSKLGNPSKTMNILSKAEYNVAIWTKDKSEIDLVEKTLHGLLQRENFREKLQSELRSNGYFGKRDKKAYVQIVTVNVAPSATEQNQEHPPPSNLDRWSHERKEIQRKANRLPATSVSPKTLTLDKLICAAGLVLWGIFNLISTRNEKGATQPLEDPPPSSASAYGAVTGDSSPA